MAKTHVAKKVAKPVRRPYQRVDKVLGQVPMVLQVSEPVAATTPRVLTPIQLAKVLQVHPETVRRHMREGMPHIRVGTRVRFDPNDVLTYLKEQSKKAKAS